MTISALICANSTSYAYDHLLKRAFLSMVRQTRIPNELVIVLDSCWANTRNFIEEIIREECIRIPVKILDHEKSGLAAAKNFGIKHCAGDYIAFCDADDFSHLSRLKIQEDYLVNCGCPDILATECWDVHQNGEITPNCFEVGQYRTHEQIVAALPYENVIGHGSVTINRSIFDRFQYPDVRGYEDYKLWQTLANHGQYKFYKVPERLYYWSHNTSVSR